LTRDEALRVRLLPETCVEALDACGARRASQLKPYDRPHGASTPCLTLLRHDPYIALELTSKRPRGAGTREWTEVRLLQV